jgi:hypothetical protein
MITFNSSSHRWPIPSVEQCKMCGAFVMGLVVFGESALARHECETRQPRCGAAIKQDNPDGAEDERSPLQLRSGAKTVAVSTASVSGVTVVGFTPSIWQTLDALRPNLITDDEDET